jgi:hypothetical protein
MSDHDKFVTVNPSRNLNSNVNVLSALVFQYQPEQNYFES